MNKLIKSIIVSAASGAAAAYFLSTEKGKEVKKKAEKAYQSYKENPEDYRQMAKEKASDYSDLAKGTFQDYKEKFESGELKKEDIISVVKEKTNGVTEFATGVLSQVKSKVRSEEDVIIDGEVTEILDDTPEEQTEEIIIDYTEADVTKEQTES